MKWTVFIAHARGEDDLAERLAAPLRDAGYGVTHDGTVMVGDSFVAEAEKALNSGQPVVLCATAKAVGSRWPRRLIHAAQVRGGGPVFIVQVEEDADVESLALGGKVAPYYRDPVGAMQGLVESLNEHYPLDAGPGYDPRQYTAEQRYRELALKACDIIDLANLPEDDRHIAARKLDVRRLYVPLRVRVEAAAGAEAGETELEAIERRRAAAARGAAAGAEAELVSVGERLGEARRLVVLGDPGSGKTTLTRWLATAYLLRHRRSPDWQDLPDVATLPEEDWLPIMVRCRELDHSAVGGALADVLRHTLRKAELGDADSDAVRDVLREKLEKGQALLLLDGLDEITDPSARARFCRQLENIHNAYPLAPIVATSRVVGYREMGYRIGRGFEHVTVADLSKEDKDEFARRWCGLVELPGRHEAAAAELIQDIHSSDRIERLTGNPMLLTTMALVKRKIGRLPSRRIDLYDNALRVLLNWRSDVDAPLDYREAVPQLEYVAYEMCRRGVQQLRRDEILELFERMRDEYPRVHAARNHAPEEFLRLLERRTGLLVEAGHTRHLGRLAPVYEFRHLTFQEYLAALALVDARFPGHREGSTLAENVAPLASQMKEEKKGFLREMRVDESWRETLRLIVASCDDEDVDRVLTTILEPAEGEDAAVSARPRAVQAGLCLADEPNASEDVARAVLRSLAAHVMEYDGWLFRSKFTSLDVAITEVAKSRWLAELRRQLVEEFISRGPFLRDSVAVIFDNVVNLSRQGSRASAHHFLTEQASQISSPDPPAAIEAVLSLAAVSHWDIEAAIPRITSSLLDLLTVSNAVAGAAARSLFRLNRPGVAESTWRGIAAAPAEVKKILDFIGDPDSDAGAVAHLIEVLGSEHAARACGSLVSRLEHPVPRVRRAAAKVLGRMAYRGAIPALKSKLSDDDVEVRFQALKSLAMMREDAVDRSLLLGDSEAFGPNIDPMDEITEEFVGGESKRLNLPAREVRRRYEAMAKEYGLKLGWDAD